MRDRESLIEGKLYQVAEQEALPERTRITIELAHRLHDLHDIDPMAGVMFMRTMVKVYSIDPWVYHLALSILAGHRDAGKSLAVLADDKHSKQHEHQTQNRALNLLEGRMPELATAIRSILQRKKPETTKE